MSTMRYSSIVELLELAFEQPLRLKPRQHPLEHQRLQELDA